MNVEQEWENARRTKPLKAVLTALKNMINARERCMYCLDSHGTDIEHFWPKSQYPERMFIWLNLLLSCAECQRIKGSQFPTASGNNPLLIDPTAEQPWDYLDFDPITGNLVARFDPVQDGYCSKGIATVETLQLDKREALAAGYKKTYRRLANLINEYLESALACSQKFVQSLFEADEHGLLGWCFHGNGQKEAPFSKLRSGDPETWSACIRLIGS
ncbi:MAG: hypothetical protein NTX50_08815 [Candidatus Sumerlaeota bacterium]|nr:hypothetical protein [Candidatus Sumerlaeota bacterium]